MNEQNQIDGLEQTEQDLTQTGDIEALKKALTEEKAKAEKYLDNWKRAQADFINYKRWSEQDKEEATRFANSTLILNLLPVLDDLERALESVPPRLAKLPWVEGIRLILRKFQTSLEAQGLCPIKALGKTFDTNFHEAVMHSHGKQGMVVEEIQKGYTLCNKVIRPSKVAVGDGEEEIKEE
jgi:molecular chaperone GrpE